MSHHYKGDPTNTENYRGISLLDTTYKVLTTDLLNRIEKYASEIIGEYQCGFRKGKSTSDHIFIIRQTMEKYYEYDKDLYMIFIDFKQAYDSINRNQLWIALEDYGFPRKPVRLIRNCNSNTFCRVRYLGETSTQFEVRNRLRQGDSLSPTLFNQALERVIREMQNSREMEMLGRNTWLAYVDDIVILG
jgi:sorting nexin-29|uniref:Retrovirus-related Pol polyprotein LINE-1 n=1 Tax=Sipha flava TaxID=143950 RepID=A0A2S2QXC9_9HEMI